MDGDTEYPTICGTGTEDYFCGPAMGKRYLPLQDDIASVAYWC
jgi:hypothetical protein